MQVQSANMSTNSNSKKIIIKSHKKQVYKEDAISLTEYDEVSSLSDNEEYGINDNDEPAKLRDYLDRDESKQVYNRGKRVLYKSLSKYLVEAYENKEIVYSIHNRTVDPRRIEAFYSFETHMCDPIILGFLNDKYYIIDGQHRLFFLRELKNKNNPILNCILDEFIPVDVRICDSEADIQKFIEATNNRKNFSSKELRIFKYSVIVDILNKEFKCNIFTIPTIKVVEDLFKVALFQTKFFENANNNADTICNKIKRINTFIKDQPDKSKLSPEKNMTKKSYIKDRDKAEKQRFYLGLDIQQRWTMLLDLEESEWANRWNSFFRAKTR